VHESERLKYVKENLNYSAQALLGVFSKYFTLSQAKIYAYKPEMIASKVYANRMGNSDEAILGKRAETTDSHERFANIDVNYFLQRLEEYSGMVILTTNYKKPLDEMVMQKLQFLVKFEK
jgi:hypothetical protein